MKKEHYTFADCLAWDGRERCEIIHIKKSGQGGRPCPRFLSAVRKREEGRRKHRQAQFPGRQINCTGNASG